MAGDDLTRLGVVVRFTPRAALTGIRQMESGGLRVASSSDFPGTDAVPNDFDGADVQYFERFGIAIVRGAQERLPGVLDRAATRRVLQDVRRERLYRALGGRRGRALPGMSLDESVHTWGLQATRVPSSALTGKGIKVAVLDTGFDRRHADFKGRAITTKLFASHSKRSDVHGHGTHCIGTACGSREPVGVPRYGIACDAQIYAGKVLGDDGFGTDRSIIAGMDWAVEQGCQVISMSLGAPTAIGDVPNEDYEQIGQVCLDSGVLVVAAAGNESVRPNRIAPVGSPANASTIMAVAAVDAGLDVAVFSSGGMNRGQDVDLAAPGVDILSSVPGGHARFSGTSMATPHVAGVAALLAESDPDLRGLALWKALTRLTRRLDAPKRDVGAGLLQASRG